MRGYCRAVTPHTLLDPSTGLHCRYTVKNQTRDSTSSCNMFPGHCITKNPSVRRRAENDQEVSQLEAPKSLPPPPPFYSRAILCKFELLRICPIKLDSNAPDRHICFHWMTLCFSSHLLVLVQQSFFLLISIILWSENFPERHLLTKAGSSPSKSSIFQFKTNVSPYLQFLTPPRQGSNVHLRSMENKGEVWMLKLQIDWYINLF